MLTYRWHLESLCKKLTSRVALLRRIAGSGWDVGAITTTWALVDSTAEYFARVWCCSYPTHLIEPAIKMLCELWLDACILHHRTIFLSSRASNLLNFCLKGATLSVASLAMEPGHLLHSALTCLLVGNAQHIELSHSFVPTTQQLISSSDDCNIRSAVQTPTDRMQSGWRTLRDSVLSSRTSAPNPFGTGLPRRAWVRLNRLCTAVGRFRSCLYKWGMSSSAAY